MKAELALNQSADLPHLEVGIALPVFGRQVLGVVAHVAVVGLGAAVVGVLLNGVLEAQRARVNPVKHLLGLCARLGLRRRVFHVRNLEQDVRRALLAVVVIRHVELGGLEQLLVGCLGALLEVLLQLAAQHLRLDVGAILLFGPAGVAQRLLPGRIGGEIGLERLDLHLDLGAVDRDAELLGALLRELAVAQNADVGVAHARGSLLVGGQVQAPLLVARQLLLRAQRGDELRDVVLLDVHAVDRGRHPMDVREHRAGGQAECAHGCDHAQGERGFQGLKRFHMRSPRTS